MTSLRRLMFAKAASGGSGGGWRTATGAVASFIATRSTPLPMEFDLTPVQDLHGQDAPYPAGGGVNKFDISTVTYSKWCDSSGNIGNYAYGCISDKIPVVGGQRYETKCYGTRPFSMSIIEYNSSDTFIKRNHESYNSVVLATLDANTAYVKLQFANGIDISNPITQSDLESYKIVFFSGITEPSAYAPYSNICPITGHDGFTRVRTGKNLFDGTIINGQIMSDGSFVSATNRITNAIKSGLYLSDLFLKAGTYTLDIDGLGYCSAMTKDKNGNIIDNFATSWNNLPFTFTTTKDAFFIFTGRKDSNPSLTPSDYFPQIVVGGSVGTYESPNIHSYETTFPTPPGTVYGGHVRDNGDGTGTLELTHVIADMGNLTWNYASQYGYMLSNINGIKTYSSGETPSIICEAYKTIASRSASEWAIAEDKTIATRATYANIVVKDTAYTDKDTFKTAVTGYKVVYPLAEPQTYTLSMTAIQSLIGQNHVWVDNADSVSVEYWGH